MKAIWLFVAAALAAVLGYLLFFRPRPEAGQESVLAGTVLLSDQTPSPVENVPTLAWPKGGDILNVISPIRTVLPFLKPTISDPLGLNALTYQAGAAVGSSIVDQFNQAAGAIANLFGITAQATKNMLPVEPVVTSGYVGPSGPIAPPAYTQTAEYKAIVDLVGHAVSESKYRAML
jgi:hypothetical protein